MRVFVVEPPAPIVTYEEAVARLRLNGGEDEQADVEGMIAGATGHLDGPDGWLGRAIGVQTLEARFDVFSTPECRIRLPYPPNQTLVGITYLNGNNVEVVADLGDFYMAGSDLYPEDGGWIWSGCSLRAEAIRIRYTAGYETVPPAIVNAILLMVGDLYENRDTTGGVAKVSSIPMSTSVENLLNPYRVYL